MFENLMLLSSSAMLRESGEGGHSNDNNDDAHMTLQRIEIKSLFSECTNFALFGILFPFIIYTFTEEMFCLYKSKSIWRENDQWRESALSHWGAQWLLPASRLFQISAFVFFHWEKAY